MMSIIYVKKRLVDFRSCNLKMIELKNEQINMNSKFESEKKIEMEKINIYSDLTISWNNKSIEKVEKNLLQNSFLNPIKLHSTNL